MVNNDIELIKAIFTALDDTQLSQIEAFADHILEWNDKINMISRKDIDNLYQHHILHCLSITKHYQFVPGTKILDLGTGGGFPGVLLAIAYPHVDFHLVDARSKKIGVINDFLEKVPLKNVIAEHKRVEEMKSKYDFVVSRAVASLPQLLTWARPRISEEEKNNIPNGLIILKGGNIKLLRAELNKKEFMEHHKISEMFDAPYYEEKYIIYVQG